MAAPQLWLHDVEAGQVVDVSYNLTGTKAALAFRHKTVQVRELKAGMDAVPTLLQVPSCPTCLAWAHHEFGEIIACGTAYGHLLVWENLPETEESGATVCNWKLRAELKEHDCHKSVRCLCFCPKQQGLLLALGYADGMVRCWEAESVINTQRWTLHSKVQVADKDQGGCLCLSWRNFSPGLPPLLSVGTGSGAAVWLRDQRFLRWLKVLDILPGEAVRALHWAPLMGRPCELLAVASGRRVDVFSLLGSVEDMQAEPVGVLEHDAEVWRVEFNMLGNSLATGSRDAKVSMWKPNLTGHWQLQGRIHGKPTDAIDELTGIAGNGSGAFSDMVD